MNDEYLKRQYEIIRIILAETNAYLAELESFIEITLKEVTNSDDDLSILIKNYIYDKKLQRDINYKIRLKGNNRKHKTKDSIYFNGTFSLNQALEAMRILDKYMDFLSKNFIVRFKYEKFIDIYNSEFQKNKEKKVIIKEVEVEKIVEKEIPIEVEKIVEKEVPIEIEKIVEKEVPVEVEKIVEKEVPIVVEKIVESNKKHNHLRYLILAVCMLLFIGIVFISNNDNVRNKLTGNDHKNKIKEDKTNIGDDNNTDDKSDSIDEKDNNSQVNYNPDNGDVNNSTIISPIPNNNYIPGDPVDSSTDNDPKCIAYKRYNGTKAMITMGESKQITALYGTLFDISCTGENCSTEKCFTPVYSVDNPKVAKISSDGVITGLSKGTTNVNYCLKANYDKAEDNCFKGELRVLNDCSDFSVEVGQNHFTIGNNDKIDINSFIKSYHIDTEDCMFVYTPLEPFLGNIQLEGKWENKTKYAYTNCGNDCYRVTHKFRVYAWNLQGQTNSKTYDFSIDFNQ